MPETNRFGWALQDAAFAGAPLAPAFDAIARHLGAPVVVALRSEYWLSGARPEPIATIGLPPDMLEAYAAGWNARDPFVAAGQRQRGGVVDLARLVPDEALLRTDFWNDFLRRRAPTRHGLSLFLRGPGITAAAAGAVTFWRETGQGPFAGEAADRLAALQPHVVRALSTRVERAGWLAAMAAWDALEDGLALLARGGTLRHANAALRGRRDAVRLGATRLAFDTPGLEARFERALAGPLPVRVVLPRGVGRLPLRLDLAPVSGAGVALVLLRVVDPEARPAATAALLRQAFGLTEAEAALARALLDGATPSEHAATRGIALSTVRSQLAALLGKTGTVRQAQLVARLARLSG